MDSEQWQCTSEMTQYYKAVQRHNHEVVPALNQFMREISEQTTISRKAFFPMGSRGFGWKVPTNYLTSDFEIAVVANDPEQLTEAGSEIEAYLRKSGYEVQSSVTKAGLPYQVVKEYMFSPQFVQKLEICYQTTEQNNKIRENYLKYTDPKTCNMDKIAWYVTQIRNAALKGDTEEYNRLKQWLRVL